MKLMIAILALAFTGCTVQTASCPGVAFDGVCAGEQETVSQDVGIPDCASNNPCLDTFYCAESEAGELNGEADVRCWGADGSYQGGGCHTLPERNGLDCFPTADGAVRTGICVNAVCTAKGAK